LTATIEKLLICHVGDLDLTCWPSTAAAGSGVGQAAAAAGAGHSGSIAMVKKHIRNPILVELVREVFPVLMNHLLRSSGGITIAVATKILKLFKLYDAAVAPEVPAKAPKGKESKAAKSKPARRDSDMRVDDDCDAGSDEDGSTRASSRDGEEGPGQKQVKRNPFEASSKGANLRARCLYHFYSFEHFFCV
jgi:hypothetical protein